MKIEIRNGYTNEVIFEHEQKNNTIKITVIKAIAKKTDLSNATLSGANLSYAKLFDADLSNANLSNANLSYAKLSYAKLFDANLSGANLSGANLSNANLFDANLSNATLSGADLSDANLFDANLYNVNLSGADLSGADLSGADLSGADLSGANLYNVNLYNVNLSGADLSGAKELQNPLSFLDKNFKTAKDVNGEYYVVYKAFGNTFFTQPKKWILKSGSIITENVNRGITKECGCGVNFATLKWINNNIRWSVEIWECKLYFKDLINTIIPYNTDGKGRCEKLTLVKKIKEDPDA